MSVIVLGAWDHYLMWKYRNLQKYKPDHLVIFAVKHKRTP